METQHRCKARSCYVKLGEGASARRARATRVCAYFDEAPLAASVPLVPPDVPELEPPLGALELVLGLAPP